MGRDPFISGDALETCPGPVSIFAGLIGVVDHDHFDRPFFRRQAQAELLLDRGWKRWRAIRPRMVAIPPAAFSRGLPDH